jgi:exodeoxyribonuclease V alpha subunit
VFSVFEYSGYVSSKSTTATGHLFGIDQMSQGIVLELEGDWVTHARYGRQFKIRGWRPWSRHALDVTAFFRFAVSVFQDVDLMERFVGHFGNDAYEILMDERADTFSAEAIVLGEIKLASARWRAIRGIATLAESLQEYELGATLIEGVFDRFGFAAVEILADNPYRLVEVEGVSFQNADRIASRRGIDPSDPRRTAAAVLWTIRDQTRQQGHLYLRRGDIAPMLLDLIRRTGIAPFGETDLTTAVSDALEDLEKNEAVKVDHDVGVYLPDLHMFERGGAGMLCRFLTPSALILDVAQFLTDYERVNDIELSDLQREAVSKLIANRVLVVTGAPGTGKTTLIKAFVQLFRALGISFSLMAPTGIAAKRLGYVTDAPACTIHRALKYDGFQWGCNGQQKIAVDAVIVDESSMVDQELAFRLLDALEPSTMLVLVGDDAQLPSVGPGNVLRELIACGAIPTIRLEHVFRQAETSDIVLAAHKIRRGESPLGLPPKDATEFQFVSCSNEDTICELIVKMAVKLKSRDANFQVLSPKYEGVVGVDHLNACLRDALNPDVGQPSCDLLNVNVRVGDRLMIVKNDYKLNVYNGDIGKLVEIHRDRLSVKVHGIGTHPDTLVDIPKDKAPVMLKLAYCLTVHKSQGEEFETVLLPLVRSQGRMLQRNLFYTAVTRARKKVWLLGEADAVHKAVANAKVQQRNTVLRSLITPQLDGSAEQPTHESGQGSLQK